MRRPRARTSRAGSRPQCGCACSEHDAINPPGIFYRCRRATGTGTIQLDLEFVQFSTSTVVLAFVCANYPAAGQESVAPPGIVIGFVGGMVGHDNAVHSEFQLATRLRN